MSSRIIVEEGGRDARATFADSIRSALLALLSITLLCVAGCRSKPRLDVSPGPASSVTRTTKTKTASNREDTSVYAPHVAELDLSGGVPETEAKGLFSVPKGRSFADLMMLLRRISDGEERQVRGIVVELGTARIGFAQAAELAQRLAEIRTKQMRVVCHAHQYTNSSYWLAAEGCDEIWLSPAGSVETVGIAGQVVYAKRLLDRLHVEVDMLQIGKYKGAEEPFTRDGPSPEAKQSLVSTLRALRATWLEHVGKSRGAKAARAVEQGPYTPEQAKRMGLIDHVGYAIQAARSLEKTTGVEQSVRRFGRGAKGLETPELLRLVRSISGAYDEDARPHVAVLRAVGSIGMSGEGGAFGEGGISGAAIIAQLRRLQDDEAVKAVVVRIDSPGGSALASDLMWKAMMSLRETKPVVVSVGNMAASGGYYLASGGSRIFADETSIIGSIGVVGGKFSLGQSLDGVGISSRVFPASSASGAAHRAAYLSPLLGWNDEMRQRVRASMLSVYELFVSRVAKGRGLTQEQVAKFAEGRLFAASKGLGLGMIDEIGGLDAAIAYAKRAGGLEPDAPVVILTEKSDLSELLGLDDDEASSQRAAPLSQRSLFARAVRDTFGSELVTYALSLAPMMKEEHALVSVPFALIVR